MNWFVRAGMTISAIAALGLSVPRLAAQAPGSLLNSQVQIAYVAPRNSAYQHIYDQLTRRKVLEELQQLLAPLRLPQKLTITLDECGAPTRPYQPQGPVTICYELVDRIERIAAQAGADERSTIVTGTFVQVVLHGVARAVIDILQVPVWGRMEDAADNLAAFTTLKFGDEVAGRTILGTARFFALSGRTWAGTDFADASSPELQRLYNFYCIAYGGAPKLFWFLVDDSEHPPYLPPSRSRIQKDPNTGQLLTSGNECQVEYEKVRKAFDLRVMPYVDPDLLVKIRSMRWLLPEDAR